MTLHDRLIERANRTPPGDPQDVLAAARARASGTPRRAARIPRIATAAAAVVAVTLVVVGALTVTEPDSGGEDAVTVAGPDPTQGEQPSPVGNWELVSLTVDGEPMDLSESILDPWLGIDADGTLTGAFPCNGFGGTVEIESDRLRITSLGQDLAGCEGPAGDAEFAMSELLSSNPAWEVSGDLLLLTAAAVTAEFAGRDGPQPVPAEAPARSGEDCPGLRSETVWHHMIAPVDFVPAAGGTADYQETVTNTGNETCSIMFDTCPHPGELYTADGDLVPGNMVACDLIGIEPEDLAPGESRTELWTVALHAPPGDYELRVPQRDGTVATLPITLQETAPACPSGTVELRDEPVYEQLVFRGDATRPQLMFGVDTDGVCTLRIARTTLTLRPVDSPDAARTDIVDDQRRWHLVSRDTGAMVEPIFGPVDLPPAWYEGTVTVEIDGPRLSAATHTHPARLLVKGANAGGSEDAAPPPPAPEEGSAAVWTVSDTDPPAESAEAFTAMVMRVGCSGGETGKVLEPTIEIDDQRIVVTFAVEALEGAHPCPGNNEVPYLVRLEEPIGNRELIDGACLADDARSTSFCENGPTRWTP